jgi:hypothetical protein
MILIARSGVIRHRHLPLMRSEAFVEIKSLTIDEGGFVYIKVAVPGDQPHHDLVIAPMENADVQASIQAIRLAVKTALEAHVRSWVD